MATVSYSRQDVWCYWVSGTHDSTDCSTTGGAWNNWASGTDTGTTTSDADVYTGTAWSSWTGDVVYECEDGRVIGLRNHEVKLPKKSTEQLRAEKAQREINRIWNELLVKEQHEEKRLAEVTAQELLQEIVTDRELALYKEHGELLVHGRKHDYIIRKQGGVIRVAKDKKVHSLCIHLRNQYKYPRTDNVIALKLAIDTDERKFNKDANASFVYGDKRPKEWRDKVERLKVA